MTKKYFFNPIISRAVTGLFWVLSSIFVTTDVHATTQISAFYKIADCTQCHKESGQTQLGGLAGFKDFCLAKYPTYGGKFAGPAANQRCVAPPPLAKENAANTAPVINSVAAEWSTGVNKEIVIPLVVNDAQGDSFTIDAVDASIYKPKHLTNVLPLEVPSYSDEYITKSGLPAKDFKWTPKAEALQGSTVGQDYIIKFTATEVSARPKKLISKPFLVKVHVLPEVVGNNTSGSKLMVTTVNWNANKLTVKGKVVLDSSVTDPAAYFATTPEINLTANTVTIPEAPLPNIPAVQAIQFLNASGDWTTSVLDFAPFANEIPCSVKVEYKGEVAVHAVSGAPKTCVK